jgi:hypothetical protein
MSRGWTIVASGLIIAILASGAVGLWVWKPWKPRQPLARPDIQTTGGTILVYEADTREPLDLETALRLCERLTSRLERAGAQDATVRLVDLRRVAIEIPRTRDHDRNLAAVRRIVARTGRVRFCIMANADDDHEIFRECHRFFEGARANPKLWADMTARARRGEPPPLPPYPDGQDTWQTRHKETGEATYAWVRMSRNELESCGLAETGEYAGLHQPRRKVAAAARAKGEPVIIHETGEMMVISRDCIIESLSESARAEVGVEFFLLIRDSEKDPTGKRVLTVGGEDLADVRASAGVLDGDTAISFALTPAGGDRFYELTYANTRQSEKRHLAVIVNEVVYSNPRLNEPIRASGSFSGRFTRDQVDALVTTLQAGSLPVPLKPEPVEVKTVAPK